MVYSARDLEVLARTIFGEARGEPWLGKVAVGWCIRTRAEIDLHGDGKPDWWGEGIEAVCLKPWQFSCWNGNDPNLDQLRRVTPASPFFRECLAAAGAVLGGIERNPMPGATHYKVSSLAWPKGWGPVKPSLGVIGNHSFYRLEG